jgi:hypothetical protein
MHFLYSYASGKFKHTGFIFPSPDGREYASLMEGKGVLTNMLILKCVFILVYKKCFRNVMFNQKLTVFILLYYHNELKPSIESFMLIYL